jgi:hypothetical protein
MPNAESARDDEIDELHRRIAFGEGTELERGSMLSRLAYLHCERGTHGNGTPSERLDDLTGAIRAGCESLALPSSYPTQHGNTLSNVGAAHFNSTFEGAPLSYITYAIQALEAALPYLQTREVAQTLEDISVVYRRRAQVVGERRISERICDAARAVEEADKSLDITAEPELRLRRGDIRADAQALCLALTDTLCPRESGLTISSPESGTPLPPYRPQPGSGERRIDGTLPPSYHSSDAGTVRQLEGTPARRSVSSAANTQDLEASIRVWAESVQGREDSAFPGGSARGSTTPRPASPRHHEHGRDYTAR